jgi:type II secretory pathway pseudopilin PulG
MTLIEMMVVVLLVSLIAGISFPAVTSGLDTLRLKSGAESVVNLFNTALSRAGRTQQPVEVVIDASENSVSILTVGPNAERHIELPQGVRILAIRPALPSGDQPVRRFVLLPQGAVPQFEVLLSNARGARKLVSVDPLTGVARLEDRPVGPAGVDLP